MIEIKTIGIIGEGKMGTGIFQYLLEFPYTLRWIVSQTANTENLKQRLKTRLGRSLRAGIIDQETHDRRIGETVISKNLPDLADCHMVIEAVNEDLALKKNLFAMLNKTTQPSCILASNSSSIIPSRLWLDERRDPYIIGIHYFYPVALKEFTEVIVSPKTSEKVRETVNRFLLQTKKKALLLNESNSFILNRLFLDIQNEASRIVGMGKATEQQIDAIVKKNLFPLGIFEFIDSVGIDTMLESVKNYTSGYPHLDYYSGFANRLESLVREGKLGRKTGSGFYDYSVPESGAAETSQLSANDILEISEYLRNIYLNSAKRFTMQSGCTIDEMNDSIKEYFSLDKGPFE